MALVLANRVQETTTTTGTGTITLAGAVSGFQSFAAIGNGNTTYYTIISGAAWEVGIGTYSTTGPTLARTTVLSSSAGGTTKITLAGTSTVFVDYPAEKAISDGYGTLPVANGGTGATTLTSGYLTKGNGTSAVTASVVYDNGTNVGIGTTTPALKLDVNGGANFRDGSGGGNTIGYITDSAGWFSLIGSGLSSTGCQVGTSSTAPLRFITLDTERMRIDSSGNVGIGTSTPSTLSKVTVYKSGGTSYRAENTAAGYATFGVTDEATSFAQIDGALGVSILAAGAEGIRLAAGGDVSIGMFGGVSATALLAIGSTASSASDVNLRTTKTDFTISPSNSAAGGVTISTSWVSGGQGPLIFTNASGEIMRLSSGGNLLVGTTTDYGGRLSLVPATTSTTFAGGNTLQIGEATGSPNYRLQLGYINHVTAGYIGSVQAYTGISGSAAAANLTLQGVGGNVGVGTAVPAEKLDVSGNLQVTGGSAKLILYSNQTIASINTAGSAYTDMLLDGLNLVFRTGSGSASERMRIDSAGFVGIGTSSPSTLLHVAGDSSPVVLNQNTVGDIAAFTAFGVTYGASFGVNASGTYITSDANTVFSVSGSEKVRIDSSGNVGIGTSSPGAVLQLNKASGAADLRLSVGGTLYSNIYASSSDVNVLSITAIPLILGTNNTERMRIDSSGNVGIGTSSPGQKLTVAGTIETTSGGVKYPDGTTQTTGALEKVDVYSTVGSTTWTKPSWATSIEVILIGGGGGGGSGRKGAAGTLRCGGGGGSGGGFSTTIFPASYIGATETVTVGGGGTGGASQTTNSTNGNNATNGGDTSFGTKLYAPGGGGGAGGTASSGSSGTIARGTTAGGQGALSTSGGGSAAGIGATATGSTGSTYGGGGGGSVTTANAVTNGGQGVNTTTGTAPTWKIGGFSVVPTANSVTGNGNSGTDNGSGVWLGGESGDGGAASTSGNAFNGGNGGKWGSAGGGGGGSVDSVGNSGIGGNGGAGVAIVISRG